MEASPEGTEREGGEDLPTADELNRRADALIEKVDRHLARRRPPPDASVVPRTA